MPDRVRHDGSGSVVVAGQEGRGEFGLGAVVALRTVLALAARAAVAALAARATVAAAFAAGTAIAAAVARGAGRRREHVCPSRQAGLPA